MPVDRSEMTIRRVSPYHSYAWQYEARQQQSELVYNYLTSGVRAVARGARRLASATGSLLAAMDEAHAANRTYTRLSRMSDRELTDMGLTRGQIYDAAWNPLRSAPAGPVIVAAAAAADEAVEQEYRKAA